MALRSLAVGPGRDRPSAQERTHSVPTVEDVHTGVARRLTAEECEVMQGWPPGITRAGTDTMTYTGKLRHVGNALNAHQCYHILRHVNMQPPAWNTTACPLEMEFYNTSQLEQLFPSMTDAQIQSWVRERTHNWEPAPLQLRLKPGQKPFARPRRGYSTPAGLVPSLDYMIQEQISKGYMKGVQYNPKYFISQGFVQTKDGRFFPGTNISMVRLLVDCRALNAACEDAPLHHYDSCPTQYDMCARIPLWSIFFKFYDLSDAFHSCAATPETQELLVVQFNGKYFQYTGGAQGIGNMAIHWNVHLMGICWGPGRLLHGRGPFRNAEWDWIRVRLFAAGLQLGPGRFFTAGLLFAMKKTWTCSSRGSSPLWGAVFFGTARGLQCRTGFVSLTGPHCGRAAAGPGVLHSQPGFFCNARRAFCPLEAVVHGLVCCTPSFCRSRKQAAAAAGQAPLQEYLLQGARSIDSRGIKDPLSRRGPQLARLAIRSNTNGF